MAHELGHHVHKDVTLGIIVQSVLTLFGFWLADADPPVWVEFLLHSYLSISKRAAMAQGFRVDE